LDGTVFAETLRTPGKFALNAAYSRLAEVVKSVSLRELRPARGAHTRRLAQIQERLAHGGRAVRGLTTHQAKGGEWDVVGVPDGRGTTDARPPALRH